jgi:hypothetical protein
MGAFSALHGRALVESFPAPTIAVTGIGSLTIVAGDIACLTLFQEMPPDVYDAAIDRAAGNQFQVAVRLLWPRPLIVPNARELITRLDGGKVVGGPRLVR